MSSFDFFIVLKVLMARPALFQTVRDNLIQGYANKYALHHFAKNLLLEQDWFNFETEPGVFAPIPYYKKRPPASVFYGLSQGAILGGGYATLSGPTKLIDRGVLGVPGASFTFIMSRSSDFTLYDSLLLRNLYNNRQVRILLALVQMAWDPTEGAGVLAEPLTEEFPPMLLQGGLGDPVVPTYAAEALTRAFGGAVLPHNPRTNVIGIPVKTGGSRVTLTELKYQQDYQKLPLSNELPEHTQVHNCVRQDPAINAQIEEFFNTGRLIDICENDGCIREVAHCYD